MSGIYGIFRRDGAPVAAATIRRMRDAMASWGPDGHDMWYAGEVGLGHLLLYNTPESVYERLPWRDEASGAVLTAAARIDNRDDLCRRLAIPASELPHTPDSRLIWLAYQRWGDACVDHLLGDWSFAVWQPRARRLFLARDHHGNTSLYYYANRRLFVFASSKKALLALPDMPRRLNELRLAQVLTAWPGDGVQTVYADISRFPPAHSLTITPDRLRTRRYWFLERTPTLSLKSDDEYVEGLMAVLRQAIRVRLRSYRPVGVTLSGGLDSGSVAVLAAQELQQVGARLPAFSAVPMYDVTNTVHPHQLGDEAPLIAATAAAAGNIDVHYLRAAQISPIQAMVRALQMHDEPLHAAANLYWLQDIQATVRDQGLGTLLTGQAGNGTISWSGKIASQRLAVLVRNGYWRRAVKHKLLVPWLTSWCYERLRRWRAGDEPWRRYAAIQPAFARRLQLAARMAAEGHDPTFSTLRLDARQHRRGIICPGRSIGGAIWAESGAAYGIEVRDPTADVSVMTYCLSVPDRQYSGPSGNDRFLIRRAMAAYLPHQVLWNTRKGYQAADIVPRLLAHRSEMEQCLATLESEPAVWQRVDLERLRAVWSGLPGPPCLARTIQTQSLLLRGLMSGLFLYILAHEGEGWG